MRKRQQSPLARRVQVCMRKPRGCVIVRERASAARGCCERGETVREPLGRVAAGGACGLGVASGLAPLENPPSIATWSRRGRAEAATPPISGLVVQLLPPCATTHPRCSVMRAPTPDLFCSPLV